MGDPCPGGALQHRRGGGGEGGERQLQPRPPVWGITVPAEVGAYN